jgi:hypothetical protein
MSREDGFPVMDVSTDYVNDPKWRRLHRSSPELLLPAFMAYTATMGESWKAGQRVTVEEAWPALLAFDATVIVALRDAGFIDKRGFIVTRSWTGWFGPACQRRAKSRARWARYNEKRDADTTDVPRGSDVSTATSVPPVRPSVPSGPPVPSSARAEHGFKEPRNGPVEAVGSILERQFGGRR